MALLSKSTFIHGQFFHYNHFDCHTIMNLAVTNYNDFHMLYSKGILREEMFLINSLRLYDKRQTCEIYVGSTWTLLNVFEVTAFSISIANYPLSIPAMKNY